MNMDPKNVNARLYNQISRLLDQLEEDDGDLTVRDRIAALVAVGRIQTIFMGLRKEQKDDPAAGSAVRKYSEAFKANAVGKRAKRGRTAAAAEPAEIDESIFDDEPDSA